MIKRITVSISLLMFLIGIVYAVDNSRISWQLLQDIEYNEKYVTELKGYMLFPKFTPQLNALNGKVVEVVGYVIPVDKTGNSVALSANGYASCYFCGGGGPASIMTVKLKQKNTRYETDDFKAFRGTLRLNATDIHEFYYVLDGAVEVPR